MYIATNGLFFDRAVFKALFNHLKHIEQLSKKPKSAICTMHEGKSNKTPLIHKKTVIHK